MEKLFSPMGRKMFSILSILTLVASVAATIIYFYFIWAPGKVELLENVIGTRHLTDMMILQWVLRSGFFSDDPVLFKMSAQLLIGFFVIWSVGGALYAILGAKRFRDIESGQLIWKRYIPALLVHVVLAFANKPLFIFYSLFFFAYLSFRKRKNLEPKELQSEAA